MLLTHFADANFKNFNGDSVFWSAGTTVTLQDCRFDDNQVSVTGGALRLGNATSVQLLGSSGFSNTRGAAVLLEERSSYLYSAELYDDPSVVVNEASNAKIQVRHAGARAS